MNLRRLAELGRVQPHETTPEEIAKLRALAQRRLVDARSASISADLRFLAAYDAARTLAKIALAAAGWRSSGYGQHFSTFHALPEIMGEEYGELSAYFDDCREKRNVAEYDETDTILPAEVEELIAAAEELRPKIESFLAAIRPDLAP